MAEYSDTFPQADENPLSSGGVWDGGYTSRVNFQVVGNRLRTTDASGSFHAVASYNGFTPTIDQFAQITLKTCVTTALIFFGVMLRAATPPTDTWYWVLGNDAAGGGAPTYGIYKVVAGTISTLIQVATSVWAADDVITGIIRNNVSGNPTIFAFRNGTLVTSATDVTSPIASGRIGMDIRITTGGAVGDVELANFVGGDIRKTRLYLPNTGAPEISPAFTLDSSWTATTGADRIKCVPTKISSVMTSKVQAAPGTAANQKWLFRQYVSDPLSGAGTVFGVLFGQIRGLESAVNDNIDAISLKLLVVKSDATLRGTLLALANYGTVAELAIALTNKIIADGDGLTPVNFLDGDRIVAEIGLTNTTTGTSVSGTLSFGDDNATDLPEDETATAANNPWIEIIGSALPITPASQLPPRPWQLQGSMGALIAQ